MIALKFLSYSSVEYNFGSISISSCSDTCLMGGPSAGPACDSWQGRREPDWPGGSREEERPEVRCGSAQMSATSPPNKC